MIGKKKMGNFLERVSVRFFTEKSAFEKDLENAGSLKIWCEFSGKFLLIEADFGGGGNLSFGKVGASSKKKEEKKSPEKKADPSSRVRKASPASKTSEKIPPKTTESKNSASAEFFLDEEDDVPWISLEEKKKPRRGRKPGLTPTGREKTHRVRKAPLGAFEWQEKQYLEDKARRAMARGEKKIRPRRTKVEIAEQKWRLEKLAEDPEYFSFKTFENSPVDLAEIVELEEDILGGLSFPDEDEEWA